MKVPHDAIVEFRCDCGSLIGFVQRVPAGFRVTTYSARLLYRGWETFEGELENLFAFGRVDGWPARCVGTSRTHGRRIMGSDWELPAPGSPRRKVIVAASIY